MTEPSEPIILPAPLPNQTYVSISALSSGTLTLPESLFVTDADPQKRTTVPSLSFLIRHPSLNLTPHTLVFDLGLKRDITGYTPLQQTHIAQRQPSGASPDCAASLRKGGLEPEDVDTVMLSHVHWDHIGTPADFSNAEFVVGSGTLHLLSHGAPSYPAALFTPTELPLDRTRELPPTHVEDTERASSHQTQHTWTPLSIFPNAIDFFGDSSLYIIDAPGHLPGHINLLARISLTKWIYLGGDCCHDPRILTGEKGIALYEDGKGGLRSVHADTEKAAQTIAWIRTLLDAGNVRSDGGGEVEVEVVLAHDGAWAEGNSGRFWPGCL